MTTKELKADNLLLQAKLDDALAEIKELTNLVEYHEKINQQNYGIKCVDEPDEDYAIRIDQVNVGYLHKCAIEEIGQDLPADYVKSPLDDEMMIKIAHNLAAYMEIGEGSISDAGWAVAAHYEDVISQSKE